MGDLARPRAGREREASRVTTTDFAQKPYLVGMKAEAHHLSRLWKRANHTSTTRPGFFGLWGFSACARLSSGSSGGLKESTGNLGVLFPPLNMFFELNQINLSKAPQQAMEQSINYLIL